MLDRRAHMFKFGRSTVWILAAALIATLIKLYLAYATYGTDDVLLYFQYGMTVNLHGLAGAFEEPQFNLTPLAAWYPSLLMDSLARNRNWFPLALKLPGILAYLGTVVAMVWLRLRIPRLPSYALVLFAASPVSILIDGFHGNLDSIMVFGLVLAGCACALQRPNWILCAVCLVFASQVKVVALLTAPAFWFFWIHRGRAWSFLLATGAATVFGWLPGILANPPAFFSNVLAYGSVWGMWGITFLLHLTGQPSFQEVNWVGLSNAQIVVSQLLKLIIIAVVVVAGWRNRQGDASTLFGTISFCWIVFFVFSPGMGLQYLLWFAPFLLVWNARWYVALTMISSLVLFFYYTISCGGFPWWRAHTSHFADYYAFLLLPWAAMVACGTTYLVKRADPQPDLALPTA